MVITDSRVSWPEGKKPGWRAVEGGMDGGRHGYIEHAAICDSLGRVIFDRAIVHEGPHVITVTWGLSLKNQPVIALVKEARDTAAPADGKTSLSFWGPPRGFRKEGETPEEAARREAGEEAGVDVVLESRFLGEFITNETCTGTFSPIVALKVDLDRLVALRLSRGEKIYKAMWFTIEQIEEMIIAGSYDGALTTSMVLSHTLMMFRLHVLKSTREVAFMAAN